MLYLKPPFHIIEGTAVFADHASETQFYFLPAMPHLTTAARPGHRAGRAAAPAAQVPWRAPGTAGS